MVSKEILGIIAVAIGFIGYGPYFLSIWKGKTHPHAFSWIIWSLIDFVAFWAQLSCGAGPGAWASAGGATLCFVTAICGITRGERNITRGDWAAFLAALCAVLPWYLTGNPLWTVVWVAIINTLGYSRLRENRGLSPAKKMFGPI